MAAFRFALSVLLAASSPGIAEVRRDASPTMRSATKARDVNGFALGMNIRDAARLAPMEKVGNGDFQTVQNGIRYDFGVTQLGRIYRLDSDQNLGRFAVDDAFVRALRTRLTAKYGVPATSSGTTFGWSLIEPVKRTGDRTLPFETNWASATVEGGSDGLTLHIKLLDFRIMWQDEAKLNRGPSEVAARKVAM